jgi:hypothetical protein
MTLAPRSSWVGFVRWVSVAGLIGVGAAACAGAAEPKEPVGAAVASKVSCLPELQIDAPQTYEPARSRLAVTVGLPNETLQRIVDEQVPRTVARGDDVKAGVAGRATYEIRRGAVAASLGPDGMSLVTALQGDIQLCKPFGAVCFGYGRCFPEWEARITLPKQVSRARTPHVELDLRLRKGCVLSPVRFDATAELNRITEQQEKQIQAQINTSVTKEFKRLLARLENESFRSGQLSSGECIAVEPEQATVGLKVAQDGSVGLAAAVTGRAKLDCEPSTLPPSFVVSSNEHVSEETSVVVERVLPLSEIEREWTAQTGVGASLRASGSSVLVRLEPFGACGVSWGTFVPEVDTAGLRLRPTQVSEQRLVDYVNQRGPLFSAHVAKHRLVLTEMQQVLDAQIQALGLAPEWQFDATSSLRAAETVRVVEGGLVLALDYRGRLNGRLSSGKKR